ARDFATHVLSGWERRRLVTDPIQMRNLAGQTAIISGALGDIGGAIARELAARGADVALGDLHQPEMATAALAAISEIGVRARYDRVDVTDFSRVEKWISDIAAEWGRPASLIIPNAAVVTVSSVGEITAEQWQREISVNLHG